MASFNMTEDQLRAYKIIKSGRNVCILGAGGVGKTYLINKVVKEFEEAGKNVICCAPTGIAALGLGGTTIHRMLKCGIDKPIDIKPDVRQITENHVLVSSDVLVIDEISMCRVDLFDYLFAAIHKANKYRKRLSKRPIQLIASGDFFQIPPVVPNKDLLPLQAKYPGKEIISAFPFTSNIWEKAKFKYVILNEVVRQKDERFAGILNAIREGDCEAVDWVNEHCSDITKDGAINLCGKNADADRINNEKLAEIAGPYKKYVAQVYGQVADNEKKAPEILTLKVGARVMAVVNDENHIYKNGSLGYVTELHEKSVDVQWDNGRLSTVPFYQWDITIPEVIIIKGQKRIHQEVIGSYAQIPLKLGYAVTIHKSQGQTFDSVHIFPRCFAAGQLYTALSRCKTIEGISLEYPIRHSDLICADEAVDFYRNVEEEIEDSLF